MVDQNFKFTIAHESNNCSQMDAVFSRSAPNETDVSSIHIDVVDIELRESWKVEARLVRLSEFSTRDVAKCRKLFSFGAARSQEIVQNLNE